MQRSVSSAFTVVWKFVFPAVWISGFGLGAVGMWLGAVPWSSGPAPDWMRWLFLAIWVLGSAALIQSARRLYRVALGDDGLTVSNYFREILVPLATIRGLTSSTMSRPATITIDFDPPTAFGRRIVFVPVGGLQLFGKHPLIAELEKIVSRAQRDRDEGSSQRQ